MLSQQHDAYLHRWPNAQFHQCDRIVPDVVTLSLNASGGSMETRWKTLFEHTVNVWNKVNNPWLTQD